MAKLTSRERVVLSLQGAEVDYIPCSPFFNNVTALQRVGHRWEFPWGPSPQEQVTYCVDNLGLDPVVHLAAGQVVPDAEVSFRVWEQNGMIHKVWDTPAGQLRSAVRYNEHWPFGLDIPLFSDFIGHYIEPWLQTAEDLACLRHVLARVELSDALAFSNREFRNLADRYQLPTLASVGSGLTGAQQLCGAEPLCLMSIEQPDLVHGYLELEHKLNLQMIEVAAEQGTDIIRRNGFYETCDLYSPQMLSMFLAARLKAEIEQVHAFGKLSGYTVHTGVEPMLDYLAGMDFDCIMHIDTAFQGINLHRVKDKMGSSKSFWIGPSNTFHMFASDSEVIRQNVRDMFEIFGHKGWLLTACPSAHPIMPWANTLAMVDEWKKLKVSV